MAALLAARAKEVWSVEIDPAVAAEVRALAVRAFEALGCEGLARVDFFVDGGHAVVNEVNTMPGFTRTSMFPMIFVFTLFKISLYGRLDTV